MVNTKSIEEKKIWSVLENIYDPEIPVLSIIDLGIVREIIPPAPGGEVLRVRLTPTYSGCPAMDMIAAQIRMELAKIGFKKIDIVYALSPAWTTDWISEEGKRKLQEYGIAPPDKRFSIPKDGVVCPHCGSFHTALLSEFGSTACKALYRCKDCMEPFDYFKCH
jgi:ring-1,2-phenylacetyl-CoA epoxidase subunit PaaD